MVPWGSCMIPTVRPATMSLGKSARHLYLRMIRHTGNRFERNFFCDCLSHGQHVFTCFLHVSRTPTDGMSGSLSELNTISDLIRVTPCRCILYIHVC